MNTIFSVQDKVALITGASSGIGRHFAISLAKQGAHVILVGRNEERLLVVEDECKKQGVRALSFSADVKNSHAVAKLISQSKDAFSKVDILINAAGIGMRVPTMELSEQQWDDVIDINLKGTFLVSQSIAKWMIETKTAGKIINISSSAAFFSTPTRAAYSASKIGVESLTRSMALSLVPHGIQVNCIAPGFFVTELTETYLQSETGKNELAALPMGRAASVTELEGVLLLLCSNASSYMTGSVIRVDGGYAISKV
ncbi:SDR family NAD(P)-dependent oxidoreductase [Legionella sp.]|uniref:SDR family NAD(P)-dependent oxidoreductase n=1 Tax=Legionella sp. TaxID=459 RepID=UPI000CB0BFFC|nr:SDR family NAD(P)-dependent oxidoreductase [Legionella sp.]PJE16903.1 MAG: 2-deoxy-D-gluconate 3-dehydrogenase [Legionella sp.]